MSDNNSTKITPEALNFGFLLRLKEATDISLNSAISEFIDNSIASFKDHKEKDKLKIEICYFQNEHKYWIIDNAYGIEDIEAAMTSYYGSSVKDKASMNQYGYGMKAGIFYLGQFGKIYTKTLGNEMFKTGEWIPYGVELSNYRSKEPNEYIDKHVIHKIDEIKKSELSKHITNFICENGNSGTCIEIDGVYQQRTLNNPERHKQLKEFLGYKYCNYLNGNAEIKVEIQTIYFEADGTYKCNQIDPNSIINYASKLSDLGVDKNNLEKIKEQFVDIPEVCQKYCEKLFKDEQLIFDDEIEIKDSKMPIKICFINTQDKTAKGKKIFENARGIAIIHNNRYICQPGIDNNLYNFWLKDRDFSSHWKWVYAEINLEDIPGNVGCKNIYPDKNKQRLVFNENSIDFNITEEAFKSATHKYFANFLNPFIEKLIHIKDSNISKNNQKTIKINKKNNYLAKDCTCSSSGEINYHFKSPNENINYEFSIIDIDDEDKPLISLVSSNNGQYIYEYNSNLKWTDGDTYTVNIPYLLTRMDFEFRTSKNKFNNIIDLLDYVIKEWKNN